MRYFRFAVVAALLFIAPGCSDESSPEDPISDPDITREPEEMIDE